MNYIAKWEEKKRDLPGSGDEDVTEDWLKLLSSPLPLFFVRFSSGLAFLCFVSFFFSCSPFLPQCLPTIVVLLVLFFGFLPFSSVSVLFMFFFLCCSMLAWAYSWLLEFWRRFYSPFPLFHPASVFFLWVVLVLSVLDLSLFSALYSGSPSLFFSSSFFMSFIPSSVLGFFFVFSSFSVFLFGWWD